VLKRYSLLYLPVSWESWVRRDACGADLESGGPLVEQTARVSCIVGEIRRRKRAFRVVGGGSCHVAWRRVAFLAIGCSLLSPGSGIPVWGLWMPSKMEFHSWFSIGAVGGFTWR
jgi:hypothetical protein